jgi:hypothetical protein
MTAVSTSARLVMALCGAGLALTISTSCIAAPKDGATPASGGSITTPASGGSITTPASGGSVATPHNGVTKSATPRGKPCVCNHG